MVSPLERRPGDNVNNCAQGYGCGNPKIALDPYVPTGNRYIDVGAGGPSAFTFAAVSNQPWVRVEPAQGSISTGHPEERVFVSVDWSKVTGVQTATVTITATSNGRVVQRVPVALTANHTVVPEGFHGESWVLECGLCW